jgi:site-specific recombinase XerD
VKLGLPDDRVVYLARHAFGTRALDAGHSVAMVAKMLGHNDTGTVIRHYFHPDQTAMIDAVNSLGDSKPSDT